MAKSSSFQPLSGIKVLDFSTLLPGPMAGLILAEAGADVLKIERPGFGEEMRHYEPKWGRDSAAFAMLNRGKKSVAIDLKDRQQLSMLEPLLREADVLLEQFRPGVMGRLGLGYDAIKALNPRIIYCSITGYGQTGPKADVAGHDLNYIGDTGLLHLAPGPSDDPMVPPALVADLAGGTYPAVVNILLALLQRNMTGEGTRLDIAMTDNMFMLMTWAISQGLAGDDWPEPSEELLTGGSPRYQLYPTSDGKLIAVAALEQKFWNTFCNLISLPSHYRDDSVNPGATIDAVASIIETQPAKYWKRVFYGQDCCCSVVATLAEAMADPHFHERGLFDHELENEDGDRLPATTVCVAPQFREPGGTVKSAPQLGGHNDAILK